MSAWGKYILVTFPASWSASECASWRRPKRKSISKRLRFEIFSRDSFTCRYCGRQSDVVSLVVDHIEPVCQGGTNDPENLITACCDCNGGKSGKTIEQHAPTEADRLRLAQERNEQFAAYETAKQAAEARTRLKQIVCNYWCEAVGRTEMDAKVLSSVVSFIEPFGIETVMQWIDIAAQKVGQRYNADVQMIRYICGIRRNVIKSFESRESDAGENQGQI